jgi:hypothetical protein
MPSSEHCLYVAHAIKDPYIHICMKRHVLSTFNECMKQIYTGFKLHTEINSTLCFVRYVILYSIVSLKMLVVSSFICNYKLLKHVS